MSKIIKFIKRCINKCYESYIIYASVHSEPARWLANWVNSVFQPVYCGDIIGRQYGGCVCDC